MGQLRAHLSIKVESTSTCFNQNSPEDPRHQHAFELWRPLDEVAEQFGINTRSIIQRMIPMSYYPEAKPGRIRFRVMGKPRRTEVWCPDLAAMQAERNKADRTMNRIQK
jgi:hypothetical protein